MKPKFTAKHIKTAAVVCACAAAVFSAANLPCYTARADTVNVAAVRMLSNCTNYAYTHAFETTMTGSIKAKVFGIPYKQTVTGSRSVNGENVVEEYQTVSAFVKTAIKKECGNDEYLRSTGDYKRGGFAFSQPVAMTRGEFIEQYGMPNTGLVKYETANSIISAECADNRYSFNLDPSRATRYTKNEICSALNAQSVRVDSVRITVYTDGEKPIRVESEERFFVDKFGGVSCTAQYCETFSFKAVT